MDENYRPENTESKKGSLGRNLGLHALAAIAGAGLAYLISLALSSNTLQVGVVNAGNVQRVAVAQELRQAASIIEPPKKIYQPSEMPQPKGVKISPSGRGWVVSWSNVPPDLNSEVFLINKSNGNTLTLAITGEGATNAGILIEGLPINMSDYFLGVRTLELSSNPASFGKPTDPLDLATN